MISTKLKIPNKRGEVLAAILDAPADGKIKAYAIFAHCFTCSKDLKAIANINHSLTLRGIAVLRFDMTGIGESEGNFTETNFTTQLMDFAAAAEFLKKNYAAPALAIGHSLGGCVAIFSAMKIHSIRAVVVIGTPAEPANLSIKLRKTKEESFNKGSAVRDIGGVKYKFKAQFFHDIEQYHLMKDISNLKKPLLILHSPLDTYTNISNAELIYKNANQPKSLISLDDMDHLMLKKSDANYAGDLIGVWFEKYCK